VVVLTVVRVEVEMNKHAVFVVALVLAARAAVESRVEVRVASVVVQATFKMLKTDTRLVVPALKMGRVALLMEKHVLVVVGVMLDAMAAVPFKLKVAVEERRAWWWQC